MTEKPVAAEARRAGCRWVELSRAYKCRPLRHQLRPPSGPTSHPADRWCPATAGS